uniref:Uncharacterized protein n=1 Tax=Anguilla anguilla TaxID=7936 RepID=A0A0E9RYQ8_ANGAN
MYKRAETPINNRTIASSACS